MVQDRAIVTMAMAAQ